MINADVESLFAGKNPIVTELFKAILEKLSYYDYDYGIEPKKTSLHLTNGATFLGIHPKKNWLDITIVSTEALDHPLLKKAEQVSKNRWHNDVRLSALTDLDDSLVSAIAHAYALRKK